MPTTRAVAVRLGSPISRTSARKASRSVASARGSAFGEQARLKHSRLREVLVAGRLDAGGHRLDLLEGILRLSKVGKQAQAGRAQAEGCSVMPRASQNAIPSRALASAAAGPRCSQMAPVRLP